MSTSIAEAYVQIVPSLSGIKSAIDSEMSSVGGSAGEALGQNMGGGLMSAFKKVAAPLAAALTIGAAVNFGRDAIEQASTLAESANAIKVTFGDASKEITKLGVDSAQRLGLSTSAFNGIATQFSAFAGTIAGEGGNVADVIDKISQRGADFASVMDLEVADSLQIFQSGLAGESEPLRKYGIDLSEAAVKAYALSAGIWDGVGTMSEAQKVQARYGSLMEQTSKTQGDFANTADSLANTQRRANGEFENAQARLGTAFLPIVQAVTSYLADTFIPVINVLGDTFKSVFQWFNDNQNIFIPLVAGIGAFTAGIIAFNIASLITAAGGLPAIIAATWAWTVALLANPVTWIILGIGLLTTALVFLAMNWDSVVKFVTSVWSGFIGWLSPGLKAIGDAFASVFNGVGQIITNVFNGVVWAIKTYINSILKLVNLVIDGLNGVGNFIGQATGGAVGFKLGKIPMLANGGVVSSPTIAMVGERGPEAVIPLKQYESLIRGGGGNGGTSITYIAAPNNSIDSEQALFNAMRRSQLLAGW